ncbi:MBL fold metallo-hydrolase [Saccharopolyspora griseoalba]|uniref:MBL fold metallo-hydrolase n=1 Tax=Saccharopolyspora griseoalba TaxID=1431848 RepID=A0ABW2LL68_9PSEU
MSWVEIAEGVLVRRHEELDLSTGLVLGAESALVIDTRGDHRQGAELAGAIRSVTGLPWQVVLTHGHFDHCFGTSAFLPAPVWAHERCPAHLSATAHAQRERWVEHYRTADPETARALAESAPGEPDRLVRAAVELDLGGRAARLLHPGPGHTDHDLVVEIPDAATAFVGDLVEQGGPPDFEDAHPLRWPAAVDAVLALKARTIVPGHGDPVGPEFARGQRDELARLAELCAAHRAGRLTAPEAVRDSPFPAETTRAALLRSD